MIKLFLSFYYSFLCLCFIYLFIKISFSFFHILFPLFLFSFFFIFYFFLLFRSFLFFSFIGRYSDMSSHPQAMKAWPARTEIIVCKLEYVAQAFWVTDLCPFWSDPPPPFERDLLRFFRSSSLIVVLVFICYCFYFCCYSHYFIFYSFFPTLIP